MRVLSKLPVLAWAVIIYPLAGFAAFGASIFIERYPVAVEIRIFVPLAVGAAALWLMSVGAQQISERKSD